MPYQERYVDTSWQHAINPSNIEWLPGYRFCVMQRQKTAARTSWNRKPRHYRVNYEIDREGLLRWTGGVKPTATTQAGVEALYARERPGSNWPPP